ncbi:tungstate ABC transporter substrate-binding protein WtpA [Methanoplanus sp. FWC-SCC4]|uniref:Tungstate ABC transporter substrate-binding protein WtpA n=1 Tax=Methanochimaera problematica TaxID=2609417 RepID=A0AA97FC42_9EURY|nr:tungstate ABC transporter substrate-binding protein WtpA [Methanoplanus sp. FWC-SCC4]WOF15323.1 tungstate ABC transporter substrate-binding protein WtpA [Methanoplanus sp. FWC-SCC4]
MKKFSSFILVLAIICAVVFISGCTGSGEKVSGDQQGQPAATAVPAEKSVLKVFHAGSLAAPMEEMEAAFEDKYPGVDVQLYAGGSTKLAKEIVELGKPADVFASADYSLIPGLMVPDYASWYATFAKNRMVLCFTDKSKFADEVNADNWYEVLGREGVAWAFSDPNLDPCGYRSLMTIQLAESNYNDDQIFDNLVGKNSKITTTIEDGVTTIHATEPEPVFPLTIDPKSVNLISGLQAGNLDYAWEYRSVAEQNAESGIKYIELPEAVDLSSIDFKDTYASVQVESSGGMKKGKPIVYGVTVPTSADQPENGEKFVEMLVGETGQDIMTKAGQPPIVPANGFLEVPAGLQSVLAVAN